MISQCSQRSRKDKTSLYHWTGIPNAENNLCVVTVRTTQANEEAGKEALKAITKDLDLKRSIIRMKIS